MLQKAKKILFNIIKVVQKILITIFLTVLYIVGFGMTLVFIMIFKRSYLRAKRRDDETFWISASGYEPDMDDCMRQS